MPGGKEAKEGSKVFLTVSETLELAEVPDLVDLSYPEAENRLEETDLLLGGIEEVPSETVAAPREQAGVPPHAQARLSWLNQVEIEFSVLSRQCLSGRIPDKETLGGQSGAWERRVRNERGVSVEWRFTAEDARQKLARLYPSHS